MSRHRKPREKDLTGRFLSGALDEVDLDVGQRFGSRSKDAQMSKMLRTALLRAEEQSGGDVQALPVGQVFQVYSLFVEIQSEGKLYQCVVRKTLNSLSDSAVLVGDRVRFRDLGLIDEQGKPQGVIEEVLPRETILTRSDSFKGTEQHPIVANAQQMLIVASAREPDVKWGLIDRMIVAAQSGKLRPIVDLNKADLFQVEQRAGSSDEPSPDEALAHYQSLGIRTLKTSVVRSEGLAELRELLRDQSTVLAGHSGVGKSTLLNSIQPSLKLRTGEISGYTGKGRHTTTSARRYPLDFGGAVIDTPGVKLFGLWGLTRQTLPEYFPDVADGTAPAWRRESFERIAQSLRE
ncbi:MAG TPA: ribosome small subunit-dependent GTPase A [Tepidisphaeraceae bacterium]|nr:ribosome small subunit-dependent GTPase A [Tepidisphaeraceae bacterium]